MIHWMRDKLHGGRQKIARVFSRRNGSEVNVASPSTKEKTMLVPDTNLIPSENIKLHVIGIDGTIWTIDAVPFLNIANLQTMALGHFYNPVETTKLAPNYKLFSVSLDRVLDPDSTVEDEGLSNDDEILLIEKFNFPPRDYSYLKNIKGPTVAEILAATQHLPEKNIMDLPNEMECTENFQTEVRKVLITLAETAAKVLTPSPDAKKIFGAIVSRIETKQKMGPDKQTVKRLMDMGFSEAQVKHALFIKRNKETEALEWLLENSDKAVRPVSPDDGASSTSDATSSGTEDLTPAQAVARLLDNFRDSRRRQFEPNKTALKQLVEMGFSEAEVIEALQITGNNETTACEWLCGIRRPSLVDLDTGLDPEGPIYKALMTNPTIQLGLQNPKLLLAFLSILENPQSASLWLGDSETAPVLSEIFKTYHAEKHILTVNQFVQQYHLRLSRQQS